MFITVFHTVQYATRVQKDFRETHSATLYYFNVIFSNLSIFLSVVYLFIYGGGVVMYLFYKLDFMPTKCVNNKPKKPVPVPVIYSFFPIAAVALISRPHWAFVCILRFCDSHWSLVTGICVRDGWVATEWEWAEHFAADAFWGSYVWIFPTDPVILN